MEPDEAAKLYLKRIEMRIPVFETMDEAELNYIKMINAGAKFFYNNVSFNYLSHRIVFYLTNLHIKSRTTFFVRAGTTEEEDSYKADAPLSELGKTYAERMSETLLKHRQQEHAEQMEKSEGQQIPLRPLTVWTSTRMRTVQTADYLKDKGYKVRLRSQMSQINPGVCENMPERMIRKVYPEEAEKRDLDPYHHRYPRAEVCRILFCREDGDTSLTNMKFQSYHDLAVRLEPIILELEREQNDLLIIAHESVLRVLYAYLMHCSTMEIPNLKFPRDEIIEIIPAAYQNEAKRVHIPGLDPNLLPASPDIMQTPLQGISVPAGGAGSIPGSGQMSPIAGGMSSPSVPLGRPPEKVINKAKDMVADKVDDED